MQIRINIEDDMAKVDEKAILEKLNTSFKQYPNNYISSLFTQEFVDWCSWRIKNDFPLDVMEYINAYEEDKDARAERDLAQAEADSKEELLEVRDQIIRDREEEILKLHEQIEIMQSKMDTMVDRIVFEAMSRERDKQDQAYARLEQENKDLKAHLYDLMTKKS